MNLELVLPAIFGLIAGVSVNYLADVLPKTRRFSQPTCIHCEQDIPWGKYLLLRVCVYCGKSRSLRTWLLLFIFILFSIILWISPQSKLGYGFSLILFSYLGLVFVIDLEFRLILHPTSMFGAILGFGIGWLLHGIKATLIGGMAGFLIMLTFYLVGLLFARIRANRMKKQGLEADEEEALGFGDVILASVLGLLLGWPLIWFGLFLGILFGGVVTLPILLAMLVKKRYNEDAWMVFIPYGPFFIFSAALIIFFPRFLSILLPGN
jgi:leader peptidase (prepilin peptidase)/N-methyltransferase